MPSTTFRFGINKNQLRQVELKIDAGLNKTAVELLDGITESISILSSLRLTGKYGKMFSHRYYHPELKRIVPRFLIRHYQTGRLANGNEIRKRGKLARVISNKVSDPKGRVYSGRVAEMDEFEVGGNAWEWAAKRVEKNLQRLRGSQDLVGRLAK